MVACLGAAFVDVSPIKGLPEGANDEISSGTVAPPEPGRRLSAKRRAKSGTEFVQPAPGNASALLTVYETAV